MLRPFSAWLVGALALSTTWAAAGDEGDPRRGAQAFRQCAACHSLEPARHLTGASLGGVVGRPAGAAEGFGRYSEALAASGLTWDRETLDRWLADPQALVPGTSMRAPPVADPDVREDLIAFLAAGTDGAGEPASGGGMMGGMRGGEPLDLKEQSPSQAVERITYCGDAYRVTLATGKTYTFWEFNLRFKTDSSANGPSPGAPAIVRAGMMGDRAFMVFAGPGEISAFIRKECPGG